MTELTIEKTLFIKAPPDHVWKFLTQKGKLALWFHEGEKNLEDEGIYAVVTNSLGKEGTRLCWGNVLEFDPPKKLVHTFTHEGLGGTETVCRWTLTEVPGGTKVFLQHSGFEHAENSFKEVADHDKGWDEHFARLRRVAG